MFYLAFYPDNFKSITEALLISFGMKRVLLSVVIDKTCHLPTLRRQQDLTPALHVRRI